MLAFRLIAALWLAVPVLCNAQLTISFPGSDRYADAGADPFEARKNLQEIERHLLDLAKRYLPPGQALTIEVLDVDLAGRMRPTRGAGQDVRVMTGGADWPMIKLRYTLEAGGRTLRSAEETVSDSDYLQRPSRPGTGEPLYYEKRMLDDWFKARFGAAEPSRR